MSDAFDFGNSGTVKVRLVLDTVTLCSALTSASMVAPVVPLIAVIVPWIVPGPVEAPAVAGVSATRGTVPRSVPPETFNTTVAFVRGARSGEGIRHDIKHRAHGERTETEVSGWIRQLLYNDAIRAGLVRKLQRDNSTGNGLRRKRYPRSDRLMPVLLGLTTLR